METQSEEQRSQRLCLFVGRVLRKFLEKILAFGTKWASGSVMYFFHIAGAISSKKKKQGFMKGFKTQNIRKTRRSSTSF